MWYVCKYHIFHINFQLVPLPTCLFLLQPNYIQSSSFDIVECVPTYYIYVIHLHTYVYMYVHMYTIVIDY